MTRRLPSAFSACLLAALLGAAALLLSAPVARAEEAADPFSPWPADTQLQEVGLPGWGLFITLPLGGDYLPPEDAADSGAAADDAEAAGGSDESADSGFAYPFLWINDGTSPLNFDSLSIAVWDNGAPLDAAAFSAIEAAEQDELLAEYASAAVEPGTLKASENDEYDWTFSVFSNGDGGRELSKFSSFDGDYYFSISFGGQSGVGTAEQNWAQMTRIVDSFRAE